MIDGGDMLILIVSIPMLLVGLFLIIDDAPRDYPEMVCEDTHYCLIAVLLENGTIVFNDVIKGPAFTEIKSYCESLTAYNLTKKNYSQNTKVILQQYGPSTNPYHVSGSCKPKNEVGA